jgi:hypothetical protein
MTCYIGKLDTIAVGLSFLSKIPKYRLHNTDSSSIGVALCYIFMALHIFIGGKSSVLMDVKPWDDETDMKKLEEAVRSVQMEGLTWGACKLFLSAYYYATDFPVLTI